MATDPFDSLRVRLSDHVIRRRGLGVLGLLGMANLALPGETTAKKKRKKKKKKNGKKGQTTTTPAPTTTGTTTTAPGTCGAAGTSCGNAQTTCICAATPTSLENVRCISLVGFEIVDCLDDDDCTDGKVCVIDVNQEHSACVALCAL